MSSQTPDVINSRKDTVTIAEAPNEEDDYKKV